MADAFLLKEDGGYLLQEDGTSKILLEYDIDAHLEGVGTLTALLAIEQALASDLSGAGSVTAALEVTKVLTAAFQGLGAVTAQLTTEKLLATALAGVGSLTAALTHYRLEQEGFRGYEDDADEGANTPIAAQDINFEWDAGTSFLARFIVDNLGDAQTLPFTIVGRKKGSGDPWVKVIPRA